MSYSVAIVMLPVDGYVQRQICTQNLSSTVQTLLQLKVIHTSDSYSTDILLGCYIVMLAIWLLYIYMYFS